MRTFVVAPLALAALVSPVFSEPLTLPAAVELALANNPELAGARLELQALDAALQQAGARPNPELSVQLEDTRSATRTSTVQWSQTLELGGKRGARQAVAALAREQAGIALLARQAELRASVGAAFFELLAAQEQLRLGEASLALAGQASHVATRRLEAGKIAPLEQGKALLAEAGVRAELAQARSEQLLARQKLQSLWGPGRPVFERAEGDATGLPPLPTEAELDLRLEQAPALRLARLDLARRQALTEGERAQRVPDLTVTVGAKRDAELGRTQAVLGLAIPLPFADTRQGHLLEALRREDQAREALSAARWRLQSELTQAAERLRLAREQAQLLRGELLPAAQTAHDAALRGYEAGKFAFLDVLDAQRTLFQLRRQSLQAAAEAHRAAAEIDRLTGRE